MKYPRILDSVLRRGNPHEGVHVAGADEPTTPYVAVADRQDDRAAVIDAVHLLLADTDDADDLHTDLAAGILRRWTDLPDAA